MVLTSEAIDRFVEYLKGERMDFPREIAAQLMSVAVGLFTMPALEWEKTAERMIEESYDRGHADGRAAVANHIHVPPGSSLAMQGSVMVVRPGDIADWKHVDCDLKI